MYCVHRPYPNRRDMVVVPASYCNGTDQGNTPDQGTAQELWDCTIIFNFTCSCDLSTHRIISQ